MVKLSVIVPCYNEEDVIERFFDAAAAALSSIESYELIFVNDGSRDATLEKLKKLFQSRKDVCMRILDFSKNFGKEAAMYAGLENASGDYCVFMDADLQHPPTLLKEMYRVVSTEGYDCCAGLREDRTGEGRLRNLLSRTFYKIIGRMCRLEMGDGAGDFRMMNRAMADSVLELKEYNRYMKGIFSFVGFDTKWIEFENVERVAGETKWSFWKLFKYSLEGITAFSVGPLQIASIFGSIFSIIAFIMILMIVIKTLIFGDPVSGWPSTVCIIMLIGGIQLLCIGILGQYLSKTYLETKKRPVYITKETNIDE